MRIFLLPLLVAVLMTRYDMLIAALIFLAASVTDLLDGYFARKRGQVTTLGVLLDPLADKLLISSALIPLVQLRGLDGKPIVAAWMVVIILGREFAVDGLRRIASAQGFIIAASELGKIKMVAQVVAITLLILGNYYEQTHPVIKEIALIALWVVVLFAVLSAVDYFRTFWTKIDDRFKARERRRLTLVKKKARRHVPTQ
jgi:CDP-diacylglycerol--glycerol-3-phosphate 3-phosphatidyltransferase